VVAILLLKLLRLFGAPVAPSLSLQFAGLFLVEKVGLCLFVTLLPLLALFYLELPFILC